MKKKIQLGLKWVELFFFIEVCPPCIWDAKLRSILWYEEYTERIAVCVIGQTAVAAIMAWQHASTPWPWETEITRNPFVTADRHVNDPGTYSLDTSNDSEIIFLRRSIASVTIQLHRKCPCQTIWNHFFSDQLFSKRFCLLYVAPS